MGIPCRCKRFALLICAFGVLIQVATAVDIYLNWHVTYNSSINPLDVTQPDLRVTLDQGSKLGEPDGILFNGKPPYDNRYKQSNYESFKVTPGSTYRFRVSNVGIETSLNFRIQGHTIVLVETEGSYVDQIQLDSLDIHVGQSYSVLVTANQNPGDYYIVASPRFANTARVGVAVLHYYNSTTPANGPLPIGPDADPNFSINQAKSIKWNMTVGAARPNRQGAFNVTNVTIAQTFVFQNTVADINGTLRYTINNVSYLTPVTPLKLADYYNKGSGLYMLDNFP